MSKQRIAIDIDGVVVDQQSYVIEKGRVYLEKEPIHLDKRDLSDIFEVSKELDTEFWDSICPSYYTEVKLLHENVESLRSLTDIYDLYAVTARGIYDDLSESHMEQICADYFASINLDVKDIITNCIDKGPMAKKLGCKALLDDTISVLTKAQSHIQCFLSATPYNQVRLPGIPRLQGVELAEKIPLYLNGGLICEG